MKRKTLLIAVTVIAFSLTSCINIIEEIFIETNGNGRFVLTLDFGSVLDMKEIILGQAPITEEQAQRLQKEKIDSIIYLTDLSDSLRNSFKYPELITRSVIRLRSDEEKGIMDVSLEFDFNNIDEVNMLLEDIQRGTKGQLKRFDTKFLGFLSSYRYSKRTLERRTEKFETFENDEYAFLGKAFFSTARLKTIYHVPNRIIKTTIPGAVVTKETCEVDIAYSDFQLEKKVLDGIIRFR